jgi:hypothetical protein
MAFEHPLYPKYPKFDTECDTDRDTDRDTSCDTNRDTDLESDTTIGLETRSNPLRLRVAIPTNILLIKGTWWLGYGGRIWR